MKKTNLGIALIVILIILIISLQIHYKETPEKILFFSNYPDNMTNKYPVHEDITVTIFWVGEEAGKDNWFIPNAQSAWDEEWQEHFGGVDDPDKRNGLSPRGFTPLENPFYFALPYNDFDENGERKENSKMVYWHEERVFSEKESMLKNRWIKITKENKTAYAQWEDVGPFKEDDSKYVFGNSQPKNKENNNAGLDVSPAVRDYLNLKDIDKINWKFVDYNEVPNGPWKTTITSSQILWG